MNERKKEIELEAIDRYVEHEMKRMEHRKQVIEDENYLYAKCVGIPNLKRSDKNEKQR